MHFQIDSKPYQYLSNLVIYAALNLLFTALCLPVITAGPALAAMYDVFCKESEGRYEYVFREFFRAFRTKFLRNMLLFLFYLLLLLVFGFVTVFWYHMEGILTGIVTVIFAVLLMSTAAALDYAVLLLRESSLSWQGAVRESFRLARDYPWYTALFAGIDLLAFFLCWNYTGARVFFLLIGYSLMIYSKAWLFQHFVRPHWNEKAG